MDCHVQKLLTDFCIFGGIKLSKNERNKRICRLYFESKKTFSEISKIVEISTSQVSRIIRKNENYITEKNERKKETKIRHIESARKIMQKKETLIIRLEVMKKQF